MKAKNGPKDPKPSPEARSITDVDLEGIAGGMDTLDMLEALNKARKTAGELFRNLG